MPAMATVEDGCGQFNGYDPLLTNGAHLGTYVIDGLFAGEWVHELKLTVAFNVDASWDNTPEGSKWGVVTYGDCSGGSSFGFHIWKNATETYLVATLEMFSTNSLDKLTLVAPGVSYIFFNVYNQQTSEGLLFCNCVVYIFILIIYDD